MNRKTFAALEKVFGAEIAGGLYRSRAKIFPALAADGFVLPAQIEFGGRFAVVVRGWALTDAGRLAFCAACAELLDAESEIAR